VPRSADESKALIRSTDNTVAAFLTFLAEEQVSARTARLYLGHLGRFAAWVREQYRADLVDVTSHDLREYRARLSRATEVDVSERRPGSTAALLCLGSRYQSRQNEPDGKVETYRQPAACPSGLYLRRTPEAST